MSGGNPSNSGDVVDVIAGKFRREEEHPTNITRPDVEPSPTVIQPAIIPTEVVIADISPEVKAQIAELPPDTPIEIVNENTGNAAVTTVESFFRETFRYGQSPETFSKSYSDKDTHMFGENHGVDRNKSFAHAQFSALIPGTDKAVDFRPDNIRTALVPTRLVQGSAIDAMQGFLRDPHHEFSAKSVLSESFHQREKFLGVNKDVTIKAFTFPIKYFHKGLRLAKSTTTETFGDDSWSLIGIILLVLFLSFALYLCCRGARLVSEKVKGSSILNMW
jgi:hypothetical protein